MPLKYNVFENIMENEVFAPLEQMLHYIMENGVFAPLEQILHYIMENEAFVTLEQMLQIVIIFSKVFKTLLNFFSFFFSMLSKNRK